MKRHKVLSVNDAQYTGLMGPYKGKVGGKESFNFNNVPVPGKTYTFKLMKMSPVTTATATASLTAGQVEMYSANELDKNFKKRDERFKKIETSVANGFSALEDELTKLPETITKTLTSNPDSIAAISNTVKDEMLALLKPLKKMVLEQSGIIAQHESSVADLNNQLKAQQKLIIKIQEKINQLAKNKE